MTLFSASSSGRARKRRVPIRIHDFPGLREGKGKGGRGSWELCEGGRGRVLSWEVRGATGSICCPTFSNRRCTCSNWKISPKARASASKKSTPPYPVSLRPSLAGLGSATATATATTELQASHLRLRHLATPIFDLRLEPSSAAAAAAAKSTQPRARVQWLCDASKHQVRAVIRPRLRIPCCAYRLPALPVVDARSPVETCRRASRKLPAPSPPLLLAS